MRITALIVTLAAAVATTATAQPGSRLSDVDYMQAARCRGLAGSEALGAIHKQRLHIVRPTMLVSRRLYEVVDVLDKLLVVHRDADVIVGEVKEKKRNEEPEQEHQPL